MKLNKAGRALAILLCTAFVLVAQTVAGRVSAEKVGGLLIVGDAISSGRGLDDRAGKRYGSLLAAQLGLAGAENANIAEDSMTSADLIGKLPEYGAVIKAADLMVISVGTDDIMSLVMPALDPAGEGLTYPKLLEKLTDPDYIRQVRDAIAQTNLVYAPVKFSFNLGEIITLIKQANPGIRIVFLSLYNPFDGPGQLSALKTELALYIEMMNIALWEAAETYGCRVIDLAGALEGRTHQLTDIASLDTSPNAAGHMLIADLLAELIPTLPDPPETEPPGTNETSDSQTTDTPGLSETTTADPLDVIISQPESKLWIYILVAGCAGGTGIAIGVLSVKSKNNK